MALIRNQMGVTATKVQILHFPPIKITINKSMSLEGHDQPCYYCGMPCNSWIGNPGMWPIPLCHDDEPGVVKWHHTGCVDLRLQKLQKMEEMFAAMDKSYNDTTLDYIRKITNRT